jgi:hypothetical protein
MHPERRRRHVIAFSADRSRGCQFEAGCRDAAMDRANPVVDGGFGCCIRVPTPSPADPICTAMSSAKLHAFAAGDTSRWSSIMRSAEMK